MKNIITFYFIFQVFIPLYSQYIYKRNEKYGIKDSVGGNTLTKAKYDNISNFVVDITTFELDGKYGLINSKGVEIVKPIYQYISPIEHFKPNFDIQLNGKWGIIDLEGNVVVPPKYCESIDMNFFLDYSIVAMSKSIVISTGEITKMYGVIDNSTFKEIIKPKYVSIEDKDFGYFKVRIDEKYKKYGILDTANNLIFEMKYDDIFAVSKDIISYKKNNKWVLINSKGYSVSSYEYENVFKMSENRAKVKRNGKLGYIDEKGKEIIACQYEEAAKFYEGKVKVKVKELNFEIDINGKEITTSKTLKPRTSLLFRDEKDEDRFNLINFKSNVLDTTNTILIDNYLENKIFYKDIIVSVDNLISEASNNKMAYKDMTNYLYAKYSNSKYACYDAIPIHVSLNYMCNLDAPYGGGFWLEAQNKKQICEFGRKNKATLCGEIIPDFSVKQLPQINSNYFKLNKIKSKYLILLFWKNDCSFCEKQIKVLVENYTEIKNLGVEIIGISLDENAKDKCEQLIVDYNIEWINTIDIGQMITNQFNIESLPTLFLLDENKRVIYKKITAEQIFTYLKENSK